MKRLKHLNIIDDEHEHEDEDEEEEETPCLRLRTF